MPQQLFEKHICVVYIKPLIFYVKYQMASPHRGKPLKSKPSKIEMSKILDKFLNKLEA